MMKKTMIHMSLIDWIMLMLFVILAILTGPFAYASDVITTELPDVGKINYLLDVTNSDSGMIGYPDRLLLALQNSGDVEKDYTFLGEYLKYEYDEETKRAFSADELTLINATGSQVVTIDTTTFPDNTFRAYVQAQFDNNSDGVLDGAERDAVTEISVPEMGIVSLQGIEFFPNLNYLLAWHNAIEAIDLSCNSSISYLYLLDNQLTSIDVSGLSNLYILNLESNPLSSIDVSHNANLQRLYVSDTYIPALNVSNNEQLIYLECQNTLISELDVSHNSRLIQLVCQVVHISSIDLSNNPDLESLWISDTDLASIDLSHNPKLWQLFCGNNQFASLDLTNNPLLTDLRSSGICIVLPPTTVSYNMNLFDGFVPDRSSNWEGGSFNYETGVLTGINSSIVRYKYDCGHGFNINVSLFFTDSVLVDENSFPDPVFRQYITNNFAPDGVLTSEQMLHVSDINVNYMGIASLQGIELFPNLVNLRCMMNPISELSLSTHCLLNLFINGTQIQSLNIGDQPDLGYLSIISCPIDSLDLSLFPHLNVLHCECCKLTTLNIEPCTELFALYCDGCNIPQLDLPEISTLEIVDLSPQYIFEPVTVVYSNGYYIADISHLVNNLEKVRFPGCISYNPDTGVVRFDERPEGTIRYEYNSRNDQYELEVICYIEIGESRYLGMTTIELPLGAQMVESEAFANTGVEVIIIPENCTYVANDAFMGCPNLVYIVNRSTISITVPDGVELISER